MLCVMNLAVHGVRPNGKFKRPELSTHGVKLVPRKSQISSVFVSVEERILNCHWLMRGSLAISNFTTSNFDRFESPVLKILFRFIGPGPN